MNRKTKIAIRAASLLLVCVVLFFALAVSAVRIFGLQLYGVLTGSMEPVYPTGSLIYVKEINTDKLGVGDVISFKVSADTIATHRIVELVPDENNPSVIRYRTKGDANEMMDAALVDQSDIIGKVVFCIPKMGYFMSFIQSPAGVGTTIAVSVLLILLVLLGEIVTASERKKREWKNMLARKLLGAQYAPPQPRSRPRNAGYAPQAGQGPRRSAPPRYEDAYRPRRSEQPPPRARYEEAPRRAPQGRSARPRYEEEYRPRRSQAHYEEQYHPRRSRYRDEWDEQYRRKQS